MKRDVDEMLDDAAAALREQTDVPASELDAARTRARILASHRRERERSRGGFWLAAAAAAVVMLGGSTAWAYWTGRLDPWIAPAAPIERVAPPETTTAPVLPTVHREVTPPETSVAPPEVIEAASEPAITEAEAPSEVVERAPVDPRERAAYRAAHTLHFEAHDPAHAIDAWDTYLAQYPSGRFALEARYNRALCLVRLGRTSEARDALAPFAAGTHGGYRQREATELVHALDAP